MSSTMQVKITLSGRAANKLLHVLIISPATSGAEMLFLLLKAFMSITAPFSPTRLTNRALSFTTVFSLTIPCLSAVVNPDIYSFHFSIQQGRNSIL